MASEEHICSYSNLSGSGVHPGTGHYGEATTEKAKRVRCPECGRSMMSAVRCCGDGCCVTHGIPPHKVKGWWKLDKIKKTTRTQSRKHRNGGRKDK